MAEAEQSVTDDMGLMLFGAVMFFAAIFALIALFALVWAGLSDEGFHPVAAIVIAGMIIIAVWNILASVRLFNRPKRRAALWIAARSAIALAPILLVYVM